MSADDRWPLGRSHEPRGADHQAAADISDLADVAQDGWRDSASVPAPRAEGSALARLRLLGETVRAVGSAFDLSADELAASEAFDRIERSVSMSVERAAALTERDVRRWFETLGDDLALDLTLEGLDPSQPPVSVELRALEPPEAALVAFQDEALTVAATQGDSVSVQARLSIGKRQTLRQAEQALAIRREREARAALAPESALVFYHVAACERTLTLRAAPEWRRRGLGADEVRLCVFVCDAAGSLAGPALEIIGVVGVVAGDAGATGKPEAAQTLASVADVWLPVSRAAWRRFVERAATIRALRDAESAWSGLTLALTPDHLRVTPRATGLERIAVLLLALRAQVAACALASHVERVEGVHQGDLVLRFAGARPAVARLSSAAPPAELEAQPRDALIELAGWAYRDASPDKLAIARQALADTLTVGSALTLEQLCVAAAPALDTAHANFAIYLRGATERYFQLRAAAQQTVSGFADATRASVASLTSDVTDNLFRTVGLIVGVAVAWLLQPSASLALVRIAAALYTGYVVFIVAYVLRARRARFELERKGLDDTLAAMPELTQAERERLRQPARDAEAHFDRYYRLTRWIYLALAGLGALVFVLLLSPAAQALAPHTPIPTATPLH
ncbi:MAG TPA: hypothetical protein VF812_16025 [Ktedonobacterales bacterium]